MTISTANLGVFDPGRLRQRSTTGNGNIDVLEANLPIFVVDRCRDHLAIFHRAHRHRKS